MNNFFYNVGASVLNVFEGVNFKAFVDNLKYMGQGMLGILVVMGVIIIVTVLLNTLTKKKDKKDK